MFLVLVSHLKNIIQLFSVSQKTSSENPRWDTLHTILVLYSRWTVLIKYVRRRYGNNFIFFPFLLNCIYLVVFLTRTPNHIAHRNSIRSAD